MTTRSHYREAEMPLKKAEAGSHISAGDLATAQLHALLEIAEELRAIHNQLIAIHTLLGQQR